MKNIPRKLTFTANKRLLASLSLIVFLSSLMANLYQPRKHIDPALFRYGTPLQRTSLAAPTNLQIIPNDESMTLSWENPNSIENGLYFSVQGSETPSTDFEEITTSQDTTYTDSDLSAMMKLYRVNANYDGVEALVLPDYPTEITFAEDNQIEIPLSQIVSNPDDIIDAGIDNAQFGTYFDEENRSIFVIPPQDQHGEFNLNLILNISQVPITFIIDPMCDLTIKLNNVETEMRRVQDPTWTDNFKGRIILTYGENSDSLETNDVGILHHQLDLTLLNTDENDDPYINTIKIYSIDSLGVRDSYISTFRNVRLIPDFFVNDTHSNNNDLAKIIEIPTQRYMNVIAGYENPELQAHEYTNYITNEIYDFNTLNGNPAEFQEFIWANRGIRASGKDYQRVQNDVGIDIENHGHRLYVDCDEYGDFYYVNNDLIEAIIRRLYQAYYPEYLQVPIIIDKPTTPNTVVVIPEDFPIEIETDEEGNQLFYAPYENGYDLYWQMNNSQDGIIIRNHYQYGKQSIIDIIGSNGRGPLPEPFTYEPFESLDDIFQVIGIIGGGSFPGYSEELVTYFFSNNGAASFPINVKSYLQETGSIKAISPSDERLLATNFHNYGKLRENCIDENENQLLEKVDKLLMTYNFTNFKDDIFQYEE